MDKFNISATTIDVSKSTTLMPEDRYGAWMCVNTGTADAVVMGYPIQPGEGLDFLNAVPAGSKWDTPIKIELNTGAVVRITRLQCKLQQSKKVSGTKEKEG